MKVIDNFLPKEQFEKLRDVCLGNSFPYYYIRTVNDNQKESEKKMFIFFTSSTKMGEEPQVNGTQCYTKFYLKKLITAS